MLEMLVNHYCDGNKSQFANKLGIKPQTINTWLTRNTFDENLIYSKCEGISGDWLLNGGEGEMLRQPDPSSSASVAGSHNQINGDGAQGNINGSAAASVAVLQERIKAMQQLLDEKERTIKILMDKK